MEITVLCLKISRHQFSIWWSQISVYWRRFEFSNAILLSNISCYFNSGIDTVKITPLNRQLMPWNFQIQYSYLHSNVIMCIVTLLNYIRMEITVLCLKISRHQFSIWWSQISVYWRRENQIENWCREIFKCNTVIS
jgi:hypothetical protein